MAVYARVDPDHLRAALQSITAQTRRPDDVVVVSDGPLTPALETVLEDFARQVPVTRVPLPRRLGAGPARQAGLEAVTTTYVAIADADDISAPQRLAEQGRRLEVEELDLVGSAMIEFGEAAGGSQRREAPLSQGDIARRMRINNPFNHPTVMFRLALAREVGGYRDLPYLEDYDLVSRMLAAGARVANSADPLVRYRLDDATLRRRAGWAVVRSELRLQRSLRRLGLVSWPRVLLNLLVRNGYRALPLTLRRVVNRRYLSRNRGRDARTR